VATLKSDKQRTEDLVERLNRHPEFREKVEELLDIADNKSGDANKADDAEGSDLGRVARDGAENFPGLGGAKA
jgi:hypothetical protein